MRVAVTGVNGFVGRHLVRELAYNGHAVIGIGLGTTIGDTADLLSGYIPIDLRESWPTVECDAIVHLAALSQVGPSFDTPQTYIDDNSAPVTHLGEALLSRSMPARVIIVSTGAVYQCRSGVPWNEDARIVPSSPYIVSKLVTEAQSSYYRHRGLDFVVMRPFNHVGPGQKNGFLLPDLVHGVKQWSRDRIPLTVGNLNTRRDYTDVRDVVRAYRLAIEAPHLDATVLNVCSGESVSGNELLAEVAEILTPGQSPPIRVDESKLRPGDPEDIRGDSSRIRHALGWQPSIPIGKSVRDVIDAFG